MMSVSVKECESKGLCVFNGASVKATQCEFSENVRTEGLGCLYLEDRKDSSLTVLITTSFHHNGGRGAYIHVTS